MRGSVEWTLVPFVMWEQGISIPAVGTARGCFQTFKERIGRFRKISRKHVVGFLIECQSDRGFSARKHLRNASISGF